MSSVSLNRLRPAAWLAVLCLALLGAGCAGLPATQSPEEQVLERANSYWKALRAGDWGKAYGHTSAAYRALISQEDFQRQAGGERAWQAVEVVRAECDPATPDRCVAVVRLDFPPQVARKLDLSTHRREAWILEAGRWWLVPRF